MVYISIRASSCVAIKYPRIFKRSVIFSANPLPKKKNTKKRLVLYNKKTNTTKIKEKKNRARCSVANE